MSDGNLQECAGAETLIFACSGAADVGEISDRAARQLARAGAGKMFCLAGVGGHVPGIVDKTRAASRILAIDGCPLDCARKTLEQAGCTQFRHLRVTDRGMEKGKAALTDQNVQTVVSAAHGLLV
jgi:uncharacterized metal-binding protein